MSEGFFLFFRVVLADIFSEIVVFVALQTIADGLFHPLVDAVYVVQQTFLCFFCGIWTLVDDVDYVLNLLTTFFDGVVQRLPLPRLLNLTVARSEE